MYCTKCGEEINNEAVICPKCGCETSRYNDVFAKKTSEDKNGMAIAGFICSFLVPVLGWIFGGIGLARANKRNGKFKGFAIASLVIASVMFLVNLSIL